MHRLDIYRRTAAHRYPVTVRAHSMDDVITHTAVPKKFRSLKAVLFRVQFKVYIVQETHDPPILCFISISEFFRIPLHYCLNSQRVLNMKRILIVFL